MRARVHGKGVGAQRERPEPAAALDYIRAGDALVVWKLDRLARSVKQLVETAEDLQQRGIGSGAPWGRKPAAGPAEIKRAKAMLADPTITVEEVAQQIGVQASTLCRHIPGGRSSLAQSDAAT